jgi:hypothetical protein
MIAGTAIVVVRLFRSRFAGTSVLRSLLPGIYYGTIRAVLFHATSDEQKP